MLVRLAWTGPPAPARKLTFAGTPAQPRFALLQEKKTSGKEVRRTPDVKLRFVGFIRFVGFNFGQVQLLRFVVVMVRSYSFSHLDSVKWITLFEIIFQINLINFYYFQIYTVYAKLKIIVSFRCQQTQEPYLVGLSYEWLPLKHSS